MLKIPSLKSKTKKLEIVSLADPADFYLPLKSFGGNMEPVVSVGETVKKFQLLARSNGAFSSRLHAPASGIFEGIENIEGSVFLKLKNNFQEAEFPSDETSDPTKLSVSAIIQKIERNGIEGAGGATFPTHLKYDTKQKINTFILNAAECEPYLSADYALLSQETQPIFQVLELLQNTFGIAKIVIGIERQHKELKLLLEQNFSDFQINGSVNLLPDEYPQGGELQLIKSITGKELPKGSIPAQHGILVNNVGTIRAMHDAIFYNRPFVDRVITISGENAKTIGNFKVKIGTPVEFLLKETGQKNIGKQTTILGGPMMGKAVKDLRMPISKGSGGLLLIPDNRHEPGNCIHCGYCSDVCPQRLMPMEFVRPETRSNRENLLSLHLQDCIECGACAYICPSNVPLMPSIFDGKQLLKTGVV